MGVNPPKQGLGYGFLSFNDFQPLYKSKKDSEEMLKDKEARRVFSVLLVRKK